MENNNKFSSKFFHSFDGFLFRWTKKIRKNNTSVVKWFLIFFSSLLAVYLGLYFQSKYIPLNWSLNFWPPEVAIPAMLTTTGLFFTIIVLLSIVPKGTQTGAQFLYLLIREIDSLKSGEEITIISPNINIGTTTYKTLLDNLLQSIEAAKRRGALINFITLSLDKSYLASFTQCDDTIYSYSKFYTEGKAYTSEMLTYLGKFYDSKNLNKNEYAKTIDDLNKLLDLIEIRAPKTDILEQKIVGFLSNSIFYIGKYYPDSSDDKQITVKGEFIDTPATVQMLRNHFIKEL